MSRFVTLFQSYLLPLGGLGIFTMTFLDSTFLPLPNVMDLTYIGFCLARREMIPLYFLMATAGSVSGCYVLFLLARSGSHLVEKRLARAKPVLDAIGPHGGKALFLASLMPPPFPFKLFVLASGILPITPLRFLLSLVAGRGFRFAFPGAFAYFYGDMVVDYMQHDFARMSMILAGGITALFVASYLARRRFLKG